MFHVTYVEELNGKNNNSWDDEFDRDIDVVKALHETSEGLPVDPYIGIRMFINEYKFQEDITKVIEEDNYKITIIVKKM